MNGLNWLTTARAVCDFIFHWCGVWLVMNGITHGIVTVKEHVDRRHRKQDFREFRHNLERLERMIDGIKVPDNLISKEESPADDGAEVEVVETPAAEETATHA